MYTQEHYLRKRNMLHYVPLLNRLKDYMIVSIGEIVILSVITDSIGQFIVDFEIENINESVLNMI